MSDRLGIRIDWAVEVEVAKFEGIVSCFVGLQFQTKSSDETKPFRWLKLSNIRDKKNFKIIKVSPVDKISLFSCFSFIFSAVDKFLNFFFSL